MTPGIATYESASLGTFTTVSSQTTTLPAGVSESDMLLLYVLNNSSTTTNSTPTGYTELKNMIIGTTYTATVFYKTAGAAETAPTISFSGSSTGSWLILRYSNANQAFLAGSSKLGSTSGANPAQTALTPTYNNCTIVGFWGGKTVLPSAPETSPLQTIERFSNGPDANSNTFFVEDYYQATAASVSLSVTAASGVFALFQVALVPWISPTYESETNGTFTTTTSSSTSLPSGVVEGDLLLLYVLNDTVGSTYIPNTPAGYTQLANSDVTGSSYNASLFYKIAGVSESAPTITFGVSSTGSWLILRYANANPVIGPVSSTTGYGTTTSPVQIALTPTYSNSVLVAFWAGRTTVSAMTVGGAATSRVSVSTDGSSNTMFVEDYIVQTPTSVALTLGATPSSGTYVVFQVALAPAMVVINNTTDDYWAGPIKLPAGKTILVDDLSDTSLYLINDEFADAINLLEMNPPGLITVYPQSQPFPRATGAPAILHGDGSPNGVIYANQGSLYQRRDSSTAPTALYIKSSGSGYSTGWTPVSIGEPALTALPTSPGDGQIAVLRIGSTPYDFIRLVFDATYGYWYSAVAESISLGWLSRGGAGTGTYYFSDDGTQTGVQQFGFSADWTNYHSAGLSPQVRASINLNDTSNDREISGTAVLYSSSGPNIWPLSTVGSGVGMSGLTQVASSTLITGAWWANKLYAFQTGWQFVYSAVSDVLALTAALDLTANPTNDTVDGTANGQLRWVSQVLP